MSCHSLTKGVAVASSRVGPKARPADRNQKRSAYVDRPPRRGVRGSFPDRSLRDFSAWPQGLQTYIEIGTRVGVWP